MATAISYLAIGAKIKFGKYSVEGETAQPIEWIVVEKPDSSRVTLLAAECVDLRCFDAAEGRSLNPDANRYTYGNNRYKVSNIAQWLNSDASAGAWYTAQHTYDYTPDHTAVQYSAPYSTRPGFLNAFTAKEKSAIVATTIVCAKPSLDGGGTESISTKVYLPSVTEILGISNNGYNEGTWLSYFTGGASKIATITQQCYDNTKLSQYKPSASTRVCSYLTRSANVSYSFAVTNIFTDGYAGLSQCNTSNGGIRPIINLSSDINVGDTTDSDGCFNVVWNSAPSTPASITVPSSIQAGTQFTVSWSASTDTDGNLSGYRLYASFDNSSYTLLASTSSTSYSLLILKGYHNTVRFAVCAYDADGAISNYTYSETRDIINNEPPTAPTSISVPNPFRGLKDNKVEWSTSTDPEGGTVYYSLEYSTDGGTTWVSSYSGTETSTIERWNLDSSVSTIRYRVRAEDSVGASSAYTYSNTVQYIRNTAPPTPTITVPSVLQSGNSYNISWTASTDPDGDTVTYKLICYINGSTSYVTLYNGGGTSYTHTITTSMNSLRYLICAIDQHGNSSSYASVTRTVSHNSAPSAPQVLIIPDTIRGGRDNTISWTASTDPDGDTITYRLECSVNNGNYSPIYTGGGTSYDHSIAYGTSTVRYRVIAYDPKNATSSYTYSSVKTVLNNMPPPVPLAINLPSVITAGRSNTISWSSVTDPDGDAVTYSLSCRINNGSYTTLYSGSSTSYAHTVATGTTKVQYRVIAYDTYGEYSGVLESDAKSVGGNHTPSISGSNSDLGVKSTGFTQSYSVTDYEGDTVTVTTRLDGVQLRRHTVSLGSTYSISVTGSTWLNLANGQHTITIEANDGTDSMTRTYHFTKSVTTLSIVNNTPYDSSSMPTRISIGVGRIIPVGATFKVEAANNGYDSSPTWEDVTSAVVGEIPYTFVNKKKTATKWGIKVRVTVQRNDAVGLCYINSVGGNFE